MAKKDEEIALEGLNLMEKWMKKLGLVMDLKALGVKEEMIEGIADKTFILDGGYKVLDKEEIIKILKESM